MRLGCRIAQAASAPESIGCEALDGSLVIENAPPEIKIANRCLGPFGTRAGINAANQTTT